MESELIAEAITDYFGCRCPDHDDNCFTCQAWAEYDRLYTCPAPAATDTGLVTVAHQYRWGGDPKWRYFGPIFAYETREARELVTRSQAEELLAVERAAKDAQVEALESKLAEAATRIVELENTRPAPAATDTGLVTVETQMRCLLQTGNHPWRNPRLPSELSFIRANGKDEAGIPYELRELVTRSQAEELLAAERAEKDAQVEDLESKLAAAEKKVAVCRAALLGGEPS